MRQRQARIPWARFAAISVTAIGLPIAGCGDGRLATYSVTGTVLVDGQPAPNALLIFCPVEDQSAEELMRLRPAGETGPDGKYQLTTYEVNDGAPAGQYQIMVRWEAAAGSSARALHESKNIGAGGDRGSPSHRDTSVRTENQVTSRHSPANAEAAGRVHRES